MGAGAPRRLKLHRNAYANEAETDDGSGNKTPNQSSICSSEIDGQEQPTWRLGIDNVENGFTTIK